MLGELLIPHCPLVDVYFVLVPGVREEVKSFYGDGAGKFLSCISVLDHPQHHPDAQNLLSESAARVRGFQLGELYTVFTVPFSSLASSRK